mmetsp:Transcript_72143/g.181854  ORF Transcript_72143/g.181854 Transcript_72143/m.181854 type:complete len:204 (-) Transcript_72143:390-1001(-)
MSDPRLCGRRAYKTNALFCSTHAMCASALISWKAASTSARRRSDKKRRTGPSGGVVVLPSITSVNDEKVEAMVTSSASATNLSHARQGPPFPDMVLAGFAIAPPAFSCAASTRICCAPTAFIFSKTLLSRARLEGSSIWYSGSGNGGSRMVSASVSGITRTGTSCSTRWSATLPGKANSKPRMGRPSRPFAKRSVVRSLLAQL